MLNLINIYKQTHSDVDVEGSGDTWFKVRVEHYCSELHLMSRLVDGFVCLYKHRIALVDILQGS